MKGAANIAKLSLESRDESYGFLGGFDFFLFHRKENLDDLLVI